MPSDKGEALRLFRLAVARGEEKSAHEVEQLESAVACGRAPKGFKDRTRDRTGIALVGNGDVAPPKQEAPEEN